MNTKKCLMLISDLGEMVVFKHSIFAIPFILSSMVIASNGWFGWKNLILAVLASVFARNFAMASNRLLDKKFDLKNPRTSSRPSVDGRVDGRAISLFILLNGFLFILTTFFINSLAFWLSFFVLSILFIYSLAKRFSNMSHILLGVCLGLSPLAGVILVSNTVTMWAFLLSIGVIFWVAGFDILYSLQDIEFDKKEKIFSIPASYGIDTSIFISRLMHFTAILFWLFFGVSAKIGILGYIGLGIVAGILYKEQEIIKKDTKNIDRAFFIFNGYVSIVFFIFIALDRFI